MAYDAEFCDGFDKYGPPTAALAGANLDINDLAGEWTSISGGPPNNNGGLRIVDGLAGPGYALHCDAGTGFKLNKTYGANYARHIGVKHFKHALFGVCGWELTDAGTPQIGIMIEPTTGRIQVKRGAINGGALIATSTEAVAAGVTNVIAWDIEFHNTAGKIKIWLNNTLTSIDLTNQDTTSTANAYINGISIATTNGYGSASYIQNDHWIDWLFTAAGGSELPPLTSPYVETQFPTDDSAVAFSKGPGVLGNRFKPTASTAPGANQLVLVPVTPSVNMSLSGIGLRPAATSATAKLKAVLYADNAGAPDALVATGTEVVGTTSGANLTLPFGANQALTAGVQYWIGYITDTSVAIWRHSSETLARTKANTYGSGAPNPAGAMTTGVSTYMLWGITTAQAENWPQVNRNMSLGSESYNYSDVVGNEDLLVFPALTSNPTVIYSVAVKASGMRSDAGARTVDLRTKSGGTTASGSTPGISPPASQSIVSSYFTTDPNTAAAWLKAGVDAALHGYKIAS